jgi:general secretion pathway protein I
MARRRGFLLLGMQGNRQARQSTTTSSVAGRQSDVAMELTDRFFEQGFTLLEVMIALAIVGTTLIAMLSLGNRTIASNDHLQKMTQATLLAQEKMTEIERSAQDLGETNGSFSEPFAEFSWQVGFASTPLPQVQQVTVTVHWGSSKQNEMVDLTSFIFQ